MKRLFAGGILALLLIVPALSLILRKAFSPPPKFIVLAGLLMAAALARKWSITWLRFPIMTAAIAYLGFYEGSCACPNGAMQNILVLISASRASRIAMPLLEVAVVLTFIFYFGNIYCGWICQKGGIQEFLFRPKLARRLPAVPDRILRAIPFLLLSAMLLYPIWTRKSFFSMIDPFKVAFNLSGSIPLTAFLAILLTASLFVYRPYCRYFCPFRIPAATAARWGWFRPDLPVTCPECGKCEKSCFAGAIQAAGHSRHELDRSRCLACLDCSISCPQTRRPQKR